MDQVAPSLHTGLLLLFPAVLISAAWCDLAAYRIPNGLSLVLLLGFAAAALAAGLGWEDVLWRLSAGVAFFALGAALFAFGLFGGGDVKIIAAAAPWMGWPHMPLFLLVMTLAGGVLSILLLVARKTPWGTRFRSAPLVGHLLSPEEGVPYGVAIAAGGLTVFAKVYGATQLFKVS